MANGFHFYNPKRDQNVYCWLCDHFQRFDPEREPENCYGECRLRPPKSLQVQEPGLYLQEMWPVILDPKTTWCGSFERTLEANLPAPPEECWIFPCGPFEFEWDPWNKKEPENVMCWTCDHFARLWEHPEEESFGRCDGFCRHEPPSPYAEYRYNTSPEVDGTLLGIQWPVSGKLHWCAKWERATHVVPPLPETCEDEPAPSMTYRLFGATAKAAPSKYMANRLWFPGKKAAEPAKAKSDKKKS